MNNPNIRTGHNQHMSPYFNTPEAKRPNTSGSNMQGYSRNQPSSTVQLMPVHPNISNYNRFNQRFKLSGETKFIRQIDRDQKSNSSEEQSVYFNRPNSSFNNTVDLNQSINQNTTNPSTNSTTNTDNKQNVSLQKINQENVRFLCGPIEKVIKWHKMLNEFCYYEIIAPVISIQEGSVRMQKVMLLRDKSGPVLKLVYYTSDRIELPNFYLGQTIRCVGRMIAVMTLHAVNIREATATEIAGFPRLTYICDLEVKTASQKKANLSHL